MSTATTIPLTAAPVRSTARSASTEFLDRLLGSDPGLMRLRSAAQTVVTIAVAMLAEATFVHLTHALQIDTHGAVLPPAQAAQVAAQHHGLLVIAIMLGAVVGMIGSFSGALFPTTSTLLTGLVLMPVPMVAGLAAGLALAPYRTLALASLVVVLGGGAYLRRYGPLGFVGGMLLFMGDFFGFFLHASVTLSDIGWLAAEIAIGAAVTVVAQFTLFYPGRRSALRRMQNSFAARARRVASLAVELLDEPAGERGRAAASRRLHRQLVRLNETALMIDAQLGDPAAVPAGWTAARLHQRIFDAELALTNMARFAEHLGRLALPAAVLDELRAALLGVAARNPEQTRAAGEAVLAHLAAAPLDPDPAHLAVVLRRFAGSACGYAAAVSDHPTSAAAAEPFAPSTPLFGGWLPGSAMVSAAASQELGATGLDRIRLAPNVRVAIQLAVATTGAIVLGDVLSGRRFYWAVIAAFVTFMGSNNAGEQLRRGFFRVAGTVVGVLVGAVLAHLVGRRTDLAIVVILGALFIGLYLMRVSYAFMVIGVTVMVSQLYVQLDEFSDSLLVLRLEETALGAGVAALTVLCVVPLRTARVARVAAREYLIAVAAAVEQALGTLRGSPGEVGLRSAARGVDAAYQALLTTFVPLRMPFSTVGDDQRVEYLHSISASRHYVRNLLADAGASGGSWLPAAARRDLTAAAETLTGSLHELVAGVQQHDAEERTYCRSAGLFDGLVAELDASGGTFPQLLVLRDLQLLDGALAALARTSGLTVRALDVPEAV